MIPRRGTRVYRVWLLRALAIGLLPLLSVTVGVLTIVGFEQGWSEASGWLFTALVVVGIVGVVAMLDARTRLAGLFAILAAVLVNPLTASLLLLLLGLS